MRTAIGAGTVLACLLFTGIDVHGAATSDEGRRPEVWLWQAGPRPTARSQSIAAAAEKLGCHVTLLDRMYLYRQ